MLHTWPGLCCDDKGFLCHGTFCTNLPAFQFQALIKHNLVLPTLSVVFPLMASIPAEEDQEEEEEEGNDEELEDGAEASRPCAVASQV